MKLEHFFKKRPEQNSVLRSVSSKINAYGDLTELTDIDAIINNIYVDLLTHKGTYIFDPEFGVGIHKFLFSPVNEETKTTLERLINGVVNRNKNHANVTFQIFFFKDKRGFKINLNVEYRGKRKEVPVLIDEKLIKSIEDDE